MSGLNENISIEGVVTWEKTNVQTGRKTQGRQTNRILPYGLSTALSLILGEDAQPADYLVLSTLAQEITGTEEGIEPPGTNPTTVIELQNGDRGTAIVTQSRTTSRQGHYRFSYGTDDFNQTINIRRVGLYNDADEANKGQDGRLIALANVNISKTLLETLTIYWTLAVSTEREATLASHLSFPMLTSIDALNLTTGVEITAVNLPAASLTNSNLDISYSISPALPNSLVFNPNDRQITGSPAAASAQATYTYKAEVASLNLSETIDFTIQIT